jgi:hypothetical protein
MRPGRNSQPETFAYHHRHMAGQFMGREMDMYVPETFFLRHDEIIRAGFSKNKWLD